MGVVENKMNKKNKSYILTGIIVLLIILLIWGLIGGQEATKIGIDCDIGIGDRLCWRWSKNLIGEIADIFKK